MDLKPSAPAVTQLWPLGPGRVAALRRQSGAGRSVVLLHGAGVTHGMFDELWPHLAGLDVVAPSLPGRAGSTGTAPDSAPAAAAWVAELLVSLGLERPLVVGYSYGGAIALELALSGVAGALALVCTGARLRVRAEILALLAGAAERGRPIELIPGAGPLDARVALVDWQAAHAFDRLGALADVRVPALVVAGSTDVMTPPKYARYLAENLPDAQLELVAGAGHTLPLDHAEILAAALRSFA